MDVPEGRLVASVDDCVAAASELGWPVALKLSSPALVHKSEAGAIELGIADEPSLVAAAKRLLDLPAALDAELLVERMVPPGIELIVAARADAVVPALVIGLGGIWTESLGDVAVIPLPGVARAGRARAAPVARGAAFSRVDAGPTPSTSPRWRGARRVSASC